MLLPAPGGGKVNSVLAWSLQYKPGAVPFTMPDTNTGVYLYIGNNAPGVGTALDAPRIDNNGGTPTLGWGALIPTLYPPDADPAFASAASTSSLENQPILVTIANIAGNVPSSGEMTLGDGTVIATLWYIVLTLS